jgi:hypothetical protein
MWSALVSFFVSTCFLVVKLRLIFFIFFSWSGNSAYALYIAEDVYTVKMGILKMASQTRKIPVKTQGRNPDLWAITRWKGHLFVKKK